MANQAQMAVQANRDSAAAIKGTIKVGQWGGKRGVKWDFPPPSENSSIIEINIGYGAEVVNSLSFKSIVHPTGKTVSSPTYGGEGDEEDQISIDGKNEYLTSITATITNYKGHVVVQSLTFNTSTNTEYGPYGPTTGTAITVPIENGKITGFFGRATGGQHINAIGYYVKPHPK
ncbi:hypothetical protein EZV62_008330 [Acer yangbiense]|uniref:Jacalin-type lectin domain-containing protein n=1 Tax=Acer yangbiense TaxID=1000413 RepID=A0A5C7IDE9_9ROSI|nr:hypothetical protein EZV62_008330 [Acer yangbiense]